jgi:hypothetical protein
MLLNEWPGGTFIIRMAIPLSADDVKGRKNVLFVWIVSVGDSPSREIGSS